MGNMKQHAKEIEHDDGVNDNAAKHGHLNVTDIGRVGKSCDR